MACPLRWRERGGTEGLPDYGTTGLPDHGTTRLRDYHGFHGWHGWEGARTGDGRGKREEGRWGDYGTTRLRDYWTAELRGCSKGERKEDSQDPARKRRALVFGSCCGQECPRS